MGAIKEAIDAGPPRVGHWCDICAWLDTVDDDDNAAVKRIMADDDEWNNEAIVLMLARFDVKVMSRDVYNHRRARR